MTHIAASAAADTWMDLPTAADHAGVSYCTLVDAVTARLIRATTTVPGRAGDWMVPTADVEAWAEQAGHRANARRAVPAL